MDYIIGLIAFPLIFPWIAKLIWKRELTYTEVFLQMGIVAFVVTIIVVLGMVGKTADIEILNGQITDKESRHVSCSHSYSCNCREVKHRSCSGTGKNKSCSTTTETVCDTCYEHSFDVSWYVNNTLNDTFTVDRVNRQGTIEPPRWTLFQSGQPYAKSHFYTNYIQAAPESVFNFSFVGMDQFKALIPAYPNRIYDYQYIDRVFGMSVNVPDIKEWNNGVGMILRDLGPQKQANVIVIFVKTDNHAYMQALRAAWLGGKKNDIVVVMATPNYPEIAWVDVLSWSDKELFKVELKDSIHDLGTVDREKILKLIHDETMTKFQRKHMRDFKYLQWEIQPPDWLLWFAAIISIFGSIGLSFWFSRKDVDISIKNLFFRKGY